MRYYFDTEFIEDGKTIDLISIGIVAEDGREFYCLNRDCDWSKASQWVKENVLAGLPTKPPSDDPDYLLDGIWMQHKNIGKAIIRWLVGYTDRPVSEADPKIEFWGYYAASDWVAFYQLFGTMMDLPKGFPMYCRDVKQFCDSVGNPKLPEQGKGKHNALDDARWNKAAYEYICSFDG